MNKEKFTLEKAVHLSLFINFVATALICIALLIYCLTINLPLSALTVFPIALLMIGFSYLAFKTKGIIYLLIQILPCGVTWFFLPGKQLLFVDSIIGIITFILGVIYLFTLKKEGFEKHLKEQVSQWKHVLSVALCVLTVSMSFFACSFNVSTDSFYVGDTVKKYSKVNCEKKGTIVKEEYDSFVYDNDGNKTKDNKKYCLVYLPYGYDETNKYNVLYLMHGGSASPESWIGENHGNSTKNMLDSMIEKKEINPLIVVCASLYYGNDMKNGGSTSNFKYELKNDLMPAVEGKYSTYANKVTTKESFILSRDHRGFGGYSMGSATTYLSALMGALDYFSYFAPMHGGFIDHEALIKTVTKGEFKDYQINYLLVCEGTMDSTYPLHKKLYKALLETGKIKEGRNADMLVLLYRKHDIKSWQTDLYNALKRFF